MGGLGDNTIYEVADIMFKKGMLDIHYNVVMVIYPRIIFIIIFHRVLYYIIYIYRILYIYYIIYIYIILYISCIRYIIL